MVTLYRIHEDHIRKEERKKQTRNLLADSLHRSELEEKQKLLSQQLGDGDSDMDGYPVGDGIMEEIDSGASIYNRFCDVDKNGSCDEVIKQQYIECMQRNVPLVMESDSTNCTNDIEKKIKAPQSSCDTISISNRNLGNNQSPEVSEDKKLFMYLMREVS